MSRLLRVEFHCHTIFSSDSLTRPEDLLAACRRKGIERVVVTDHNGIEGALRARELDPERVIVGEEIKTSQGELLAAFVTEIVPKNLPPVETIQILREQGAFISVSHPFDFQRSGAWQPEELLKIVSLVDAIEVFNSRCLSAEPNRAAAAFAAQHALLGTVGSDAHAVQELGRAVLLLPEFHDASGLKEVLRTGQVETRLSGAWVHFYSSWARMYKQMLNRG